MNSNRRALLFSVVLLGFLIPVHAQDDFLTRGEVEEVRDAQEPDKRLELYLLIAQRRIDAIKTALSSKKSAAGRTTQKSLEEYTAILEALETTLEDGREKRAIREKDLEKATALETDAQKGAFREVQGREPPRLPAAAPREPREAPQSQPPAEEGPPRRRGTQAPPAGDEEGPPRRSRTR